MKNIILLLILIFSIQVYSQNTFPSSGNVGIGTTTPSEELEVVGKIKTNSAYFTNSPTGTHWFLDNDQRVSTSRVFSGGTLLGTGGQRTINFYDFPQSNMNSTSQIWFSLVDRNFKDRLRFWANTGGSSSFLLYDKNQTKTFEINENGSGIVHVQLPNLNSYVTIGTNSYSDGSELYKLSVNGAIRADRVKVYTDWADFVFEDDYKLPTLEEVEKHILEYGHLQDIPSAKEVEENGVELGEISKLLLQKVEELTLYMIEKDKQIKSLQKEIEDLKGINK